MVTQRRVTSKHAKRTSDRMRQSTIGTHVARDTRSSGRSVPSNNVTFSNTRATGRATRGEVNTITPTTASGESVSAYRHRSRQAHYAETIQRRARRKRILGFLLAAVIVVGLAVGAGFLAFRGTVGTGMSLNDSDAKSALVAAKDGEAVYTLVAADLGTVAQPLGRSGPDVVLLVRLDEQAKSIAIIDIPADLRVTLSDGATHRLFEATNEGDSQLVAAVAKFANVDISHFVKVDKQGLIDIVDKLGGVTVDVDQVIDDPHAGSAYIPAGSQTLTGEAMLTYLRATNLKLGVLDQMNHQLAFATNLFTKLFSEGDGVRFATTLDSIDELFRTDYAFGDLEKLQQWLKDVPASAYTQVTTPGYTTATTGVVDTEVSYYVASASDMASIIEMLDEGADPNADATAVANIDKTAFKVVVQNGTNIAGAANSTADALRAAGFTLGEVGNAEQPVYDETLVIYKGDDGPLRAQSVINTLGIGRAVFASYYYEFDGDILVIIGADYMPTA